jgi:hypothetical protein
VNSCQLGRKIPVSDKLKGIERNIRTGWRRGWDSNPRDPFGPNGFQDRRSQPLSYPSCKVQFTCKWSRFQLGRKRVRSSMLVSACGGSPSSHECWSARLICETASKQASESGPLGCIHAKSGHAKKSKPLLYSFRSVSCKLILVQFVS